MAQWCRWHDRIDQADEAGCECAARTHERKQPARAAVPIRTPVQIKDEKIRRYHSHALGTRVHAARGHHTHMTSQSGEHLHLFSSALHHIQSSDLITGDTLNLSHARTSFFLSMHSDADSDSETSPRSPTVDAILILRLHSRGSLPLVALLSDRRGPMGAPCPEEPCHRS